MRRRFLKSYSEARPRDRGEHVDTVGPRTCSLWLVASAAAIAVIGAGSAAARVEPYDLLIIDGTVVDGSGRSAQQANIGVRAGRIAFIGKAGGAARRILDAKGLVVAPGFIDVHNHALDHVASVSGPIRNEAYVRQGVTTLVGGADGRMSPSEILATSERLQRVGTTTNYAFYVGHNGIRREVMGMAQRPPTDVELSRMRNLVRQGMEIGAVGLSSGLMYPPGMYSETEEVIALAKEVRPFGGIYDTHTRDPVFRYLETNEEALRIGREAGVPVKIAHEKAAGLANKGRMRGAIALIEAARAAGQRVFTDQYPYDGALVSRLEDWFVVPGTSATSARPDAAAVRSAVGRARGDAAFAAQLRAATERGENGGFSWVKAVGYGSMRIVASADFPELVGENVELLARARRTAPFALILELLANSRAPILIAGTVEESEVQELLVRPWNMIGSDGGLVSAERSTSLHPRSTGTFARVLGRYVREMKLLTLPEAVRKMTSLPADVLGLHDRGLLRVGKAADIVVFDAERIIDRSSWSEPHRMADGVSFVIVNGIVVLDEGNDLKSLPGRWLKRAPKAAVAKR